MSIVTDRRPCKSNFPNLLLSPSSQNAPICLCYSRRLEHSVKDNKFIYASMPDIFKRWTYHANWLIACNACSLSLWENGFGPASIGNYWTVFVRTNTIGSYSGTSIKFIKYNPSRACRAVHRFLHLLPTFRTLTTRRLIVNHLIIK